MARVKFWQYIVDEEGRPIQNATIKFYLANTTTPADIFLHPTAGRPTDTDTYSLKSDGNGYFEFYVGDEWESNGGYEASQKFKLVWSKAGIATGTINNIDLLPQIFQVDETDNTSLEKDVKNKLISNALAYKWNSHVEAQYGSYPHGIRPVDINDTNTVKNKLVSNSLVNYLFSVLATAGTISIQASAAVAREFSVSSWTSSSGEYFTEVNHFLGREYPVVQIRDAGDDELIVPSNIETISNNSLRIWVSEDINAEITIIG